MVEDDLIHLVDTVFPQFFSVSTSSKRLYQVVDERGQLRLRRCRSATIAGELVVEEPFVDTVDGWVLRVDPEGHRREAALDRASSSSTRC